MLDTFDIWDLFIGIFAPQAKAGYLVATLAQTDTLLHGCVEEGLLKSHEVQEFRTALKRLRSRAVGMSVQVNTAKNCGDEFVNLLKGMTSKINRLCKKVTVVRAHISTISDRERQEKEKTAARSIGPAQGSFCLTLWGISTLLRACLCCCSYDEDDEDDILLSEVAIPAADIAHLEHSTPPTPAVIVAPPPPISAPLPSIQYSSISEDKHAMDDPPSYVATLRHSSGRPPSSSHLRKSLGTPLSRALTFARVVRRSQRSRSSKVTGQLDTTPVSSAILVSMEPWQADPDWEDMGTQKVRVAG